jgi:hypothetical protein
MRCKYLLDRPGREAVAGDVDNVIGPAHDPEITVVIDIPGIRGEIVARIHREIRPFEVRIVAEERHE